MNQNKKKNTGLFELSAIALDNGFILWESSNDWVQEVTTYKCLLGKHAGEVITVFSDYGAGTVREVEYSGEGLEAFRFEGWELVEGFRPHTPGLTERYMEGFDRQD